MIGTVDSVLIREVSLIQSVLYREVALSQALYAHAKLFLLGEVQGDDFHTEALNLQYKP